MHMVEFAPAGPRVSLLGFGCASVMGRVSGSQALDAMACALDLGVTHFDVARSYGFGDAEKVLGEFIRGKRDRVTITSKFGIVAPHLKTWQRLARPLVRPLRNALAPLRKRVRTVSGSLLGQCRHDAAYARECLETSLRELGTDYIDFYLLHEPRVAHLPQREELRDFLDGRVRAGQIRAWGLAHPAGEDEATQERLGSVIQQPSSFGRGVAGAAADTRFRFVTQPMAGGDAALAAPALLATARRLGLSHAEAMFAWACHEAGERGAVVAGMYTREHIADNVAAVERYSRERASLEDALSMIPAVP